MNSSYKSSLDYSDIFKTICFLKNPKRIMEFGILDGFSLQALIDSTNRSTTTIEAFDIFEEFNGNSSKREIITHFKDYSNVTIKYGNFYNMYKDIADKSIDLLHVDIANDGNVYQFVFEQYISKMTPNSIILLEGGSRERDNIPWMKTYNKQSMQEILEKYKTQYEIYTMEKFPSLTIIKIP